MKKFLCIILASLAACLCVLAKDLKVLTIGNSFADSVFVFLPKIMEADTENTLVLERANHGGCELDRHWSYVEKEEKDPEAKMYRNGTMKLREILESKDWDIVTIQQASHKSWQPESYRPYARLLRDYVKKHAPTAEVVIQQTWAYVKDDNRLPEGGAWGFGQEGMYERLTDAYAGIAKELDLRVIPTGFAVQTARRDQKQTPRPLPEGGKPQTVEFSDDFVGSATFKPDADGNLNLAGMDTIHLNTRGQYLQACLWYAFLFDTPAKNINFVPKNIPLEDAEFLSKTADKALKKFKQPRE